jgi:hypothetical protein
MLEMSRLMKSESTSAMVANAKVPRSQRGSILPLMVMRLKRTCTKRIMYQTINAITKGRRTAWV